MLRMLFEKTGTAVWMSHLDTMRLMQRAFRRAGVVLHHSQGYTPHAYVSMLLPLNVGTQSACEIMEYELDAELALTPEQMNAVLPQGVRVRSVSESARKAKELTHLRAQLRLKYDTGAPDAGAIKALLNQPTLMVVKRTKRGEEDTDIRPLLTDFEVTAGENELCITCTVCAQNPSLNPMLLVCAIERHLPECKPDEVICRRIEVLDAQGNVFR